MSGTAWRTRAPHSLAQIILMNESHATTMAGGAHADFPPCAICGGARWSTAYDGPIRDGVFGQTKRASVGRCGQCGVERLAESACLPEKAYEGEAYRTQVGQDHDPARHFASHDELARFPLEALWPTSLRGKVVADVGCGGGSLLDHIKGVCDTAVAIDPDRLFGADLQKRGYRWYPSTRDAAADFAGKIDVALSSQVIEHVADPRTFLADIRDLLAPGGVLLVSTPNRQDIMMDLLPAEFPAFFYRTQHRWYFDAATLRRCAEAAGLSVDEVRSIHRYGMANAMLWLRDRKPSGRSPLPGIDRAADDLWKAHLNATGRGDNLFAIFKAQ